MKKSNEQFILKDHSRFNRWVKDLDEKDKSLAPSVRKSKWVLIVASVFVLFGLSFIVFPTVKINPEPLATPNEITQPIDGETATQSAFELPVDSFENHLKTVINEELPEKE